MPPLRRPQVGAFLVRTSVVLALLTTCYYLVPAESPLHSSETGARSIGSVLALAGSALIMRTQLRAALRQRTLRTRAEAVLTALYLLILFFALAYYRIAVQAPDQFDGIRNHTDALYFTVTITGTVGFGDITAVGTAARALVTFHMLVNLVYVGTALRLVTSLGPPQPYQDGGGPGRGTVTAAEPTDTRPS